MVHLVNWHRNSGRATHSLYDTSMHGESKLQRECPIAADEAERLEVLRKMPHATVTFYELDEGEPF